MFKQQLNQARIDLSITPRGPMLIRSGRTGADPTRPDLEWVRTTIDGRSSVYIPGSSLKGVMRAHAERLLLSEELAITPTFPDRTHRGFKQDTPGDQAYAGTCPLGRTFGTLSVKGRVGVTDHTPGGHEAPGSPARLAEIDRANAVEQRNGVAIDRLLGSAKGGALYDQEVVVQGRFDGRIVLRNFQLYQLALVLLVLRDLDAGYVQIGSGTSRGNGWVAAEVRRIVIESRRGKSGAGKLAGAGAIGQGLADYQLFSNDEIELPAGITAQPRLVWDQVELSTGQVDSLAETLVEQVWLGFLEQARGKEWQA
jgi:CRISPR/Cas system CSM-associated protein Csm3 (group 7 of RAMP superfamily)